MIPQRCVQLQNASNDLPKRCALTRSRWRDLVLQELLGDDENLPYQPLSSFQIAQRHRQELERAVRENTASPLTRRHKRVQCHVTDRVGGTTPDLTLQHPAAAPPLIGLIFRNVDLINVVGKDVSKQRGMTECSHKAALLLQRLANVFGEDDSALRYTVAFSATSIRLLGHRFELFHATMLLDAAAVDVDVR